MPIQLNEILVPFRVIEYEFDPDEYVCAICDQHIQLTRDNNYEPKQHTLDHCFQVLIERWEKVLKC